MDVIDGWLLNELLVLWKTEERVLGVAKPPL